MKIEITKYGNWFNPKGALQILRLLPYYHKSYEVKVTKNSYNNIERLNILMILVKGYLLENVPATTGISITIVLVSISDFI